MLQSVSSEDEYDEDFQLIVLETIGLLPYIIKEILVKADGKILSDICFQLNKCLTRIIQEKPWVKN